MLYFEEDNREERGETGDVELAEIDVAYWEKENGLCVVLEKYRLEVLRQHYNSQVAGY